MQGCRTKDDKRMGNEAETTQLCHSTGYGKEYYESNCLYTGFRIADDVWIPAGKRSRRRISRKQRFYELFHSYLSGLPPVPTLVLPYRRLM